MAAILRLPEKPAFTTPQHGTLCSKYVLRSQLAVIETGVFPTDLDPIGPNDQ
jgi:hypothetical protein